MELLTSGHWRERDRAESDDGAVPRDSLRGHPDDPATPAAAYAQIVAAVLSKSRPRSIRESDGRRQTLTALMRSLPRGQRVTAWREIAEMKRVHAVVRGSEERLRTLADSVPAKLYLMDLEGRITYANRRLYVYTGALPGSLLGLGWVEYVHPDDLPKVRACWQQAAQESSSYEVEFRIRKAAGAYRWFLVRGNQISDASGQVVGWCGAAIDIDEARQAQTALRAANESKDVFLATLAHELRNPLAPIRNAARILASPQADARATEWCRDVIGRQAAVMARLLDDLLDVARITRGKLELRREPVLLWGLLGNAVETSRPLIDARGHELVVRLPDQPVRMKVDPVRIIQVVSNLLNNAAKYTPAKGRIELTAKATDSEVIIEVSDNGIGIRPDALQGIFAMFSQVDGAREEAEGGLGIGLALVKGLVDMHGGSVEAHSDGLGRGSTFRVALPRPKFNDIDSRRTASKARHAVSRRILVVDDNRDIADSLALFLELEGHTIRVARSGAEALEAAPVFTPEIALLDVGMPGMNGYDLARRLRELPLTPRPMLIAVTGWGTEGDKQKATEAGFDRHLTKPVDPDLLADLVAAGP